MRLAIIVPLLLGFALAQSPSDAQDWIVESVGWSTSMARLVADISTDIEVGERYDFSNLSPAFEEQRSTLLIQAQQLSQASLTHSRTYANLFSERRDSKSQAFAHLANAVQDELTEGIYLLSDLSGELSFREWRELCRPYEAAAEIRKIWLFVVTSF